MLFGSLTLAGVLLGFPTVSGAQCRFPSNGAGEVLTYTLEPTVSQGGTVLHVTLAFPGSPTGTDMIEVPTTWAGQTLRGVTTLRAVSSGTEIAAGARPRREARQALCKPPRRARI